MKRLMVSLAAGVFAFASGVACAADVVEVPDSSASTGPALAPFSGRLVMAWAGEAGIASHPVWYSVFNGTSFSAQVQVRGALTGTAPALAVAGGKLYLATTPPNENDRIYSYEATGLEFVSAGVPLCDEQTCAQTRAAPALLGAGATLYAAWTTPSGEIKFAARTNGVWSIAAEPIPDAVTSPTTGPTLALYEGRVHLAWVGPEGEALWAAVGTPVISSASVPPSSLAWSKPVEIPEATKLAPALGALTLGSSPNNPGSSVLFLAWTTADSTIGFARWNPASGQWTPTQSPIPQPAGPLTSEAVALASFTFTMNEECFRSNDTGFTGVNKPHRSMFMSIHAPCPGP